MTLDLCPPPLIAVVTSAVNFHILRADSNKNSRENIWLTHDWHSAISSWCCGLQQPSSSLCNIHCTLHWDEASRKVNCERTFFFHGGGGGRWGGRQDEVGDAETFPITKLSRHCDFCPVDQPTRPYQVSVCLFIYLFLFLSVSDDRIIPIPRAHIFIRICLCFLFFVLFCFVFFEKWRQMKKEKKDEHVVNLNSSWSIGDEHLFTPLRSFWAPPPQKKGRVRAIRCPASLYLWWWWWWSALVCDLHVTRCYRPKHKIKKGCLLLYRPSLGWWWWTGGVVFPFRRRATPTPFQQISTPSFFFDCLLSRKNELTWFIRQREYFAHILFPYDANPRASQGRSRFTIYYITSIIYQVKEGKKLFSTISTLYRQLFQGFSRFLWYVSDWILFDHCYFVCITNSECFSIAPMSRDRNRIRRFWK